MQSTGGGMVRETIDVCRSNVPRADCASSGLPRSPMVPWAVTGMPISSAAVQNASSSGDGWPVPFGNDTMHTDGNPSVRARFSSPIASSMPLAGMRALPISRSGATEQ